MWINLAHRKEKMYLWISYLERTNVVLISNILGRSMMKDYFASLLFMNEYLLGNRKIDFNNHVTLTLLFLYPPLSKIYHNILVSTKVVSINLFTKLFIEK